MAHTTTSLILSGLSADSTYAVGDLLNSHPHVCLGTERYKFQYLLHRNFSPTFFDLERFFAFHRSDTDLRPNCTLRWRRHYDLLASRRSECQLIGDCQMGLTPVLEDLFLAVPGIRFVFVLQNLKDLALQQYHRAQATDADPVAAFSNACSSWAEHCAVLHNHLRNRELRKSVILLNFDQFFSAEQKAPGHLLSALGLSQDAAFDDFFGGQQARFAARRPSPRLPKALAEIYKTTDQSDIRALRKLTLTHVMA